MGVGRLTLPRTVESAYKANVEPPQFWTGETTNRKNLAAVISGDGY